MQERYTKHTLTDELSSHRCGDRRWSSQGILKTFICCSELGQIDLFKEVVEEINGSYSGFSGIVSVALQEWLAHRPE